MSVQTPATTVRSVRAATDYLAVAEVAPGIYEVYNDCGEQYIVDIEGPACTCKDFEYRAGTDFDIADGCKHVRRCRFERGEIDVSPLLATDLRLDPVLLKHIDSGDSP